MRYIHELPDWPKFSWDDKQLSQIIGTARYKQGLLVGKLRSLGFDICAEAGFETLALDVVKSSEIEGEMLDMGQVRSSLARRLGIKHVESVCVSKKVEGVVEMLIDATQKYEIPLTEQRILHWHTMLFSGKGSHPLRIGSWRTEKDGAMQVVSGYYGHEKVHFEAPAAERLESEIGRFIEWCNADLSLDPIIRAGIAHLWFVIIHPLEDGNGRIARAIADYMLAKADGLPQRFYSMSAQLEHERNAYYEILERIGKGSMDITQWLVWFIGCFERSIEASEKTLEQVLVRAHVWKHAVEYPLNDRQRKVLVRLLDNFEGKLTSSKYAKLAKCSSDTALRDIKEMVEYNILKQGEAGGRSTSYVLTQTSDE
ncbi:cell filamentation protein Fic [Desulfovibrio sp. An276]|uniref:Fic family protein n=1 Tax=Desulfovibrio sp. An276 TaxID=1965618 RepID=UPI000B3728F8|nr:Fic family protein [Desulfovibrio sp. An276]OUO50706.1 cell filamentation protein Fic [Desulfovibrio sp. An276]